MPFLDADAAHADGAHGDAAIVGGTVGGQRDGLADGLATEGLPAMGLPAADLPGSDLPGAALSATSLPGSGPAFDRPTGRAAATLEALVPSGLRRDLLTALRRGGPAAPDQLADRIGASRTGVVQQLHALEEAGLVTRETVRHCVGRPRHVYDVTAAAQGLFPANYDGLVTGLLSAVESVGGDDLVAAVFEARRHRLVERLRSQLEERLPGDAPLVDRVRELAVLQDDQGYLSEAEAGADGSVRLVEHNCAIFHVAHGTPAACAAEIALFREVLDADVVREEHIATGGRCCTYRITPRT